MRKAFSLGLAFFLVAGTVSLLFLVPIVPMGQVLVIDCVNRIPRCSEGYTSIRGSVTFWLFGIGAVDIDYPGIYQSNLNHNYTVEID
ncbi:MAG: hypothetical protein HY296_03400 [Thaumarchaeota archaeon]|nr:hypothetical protein [Nitrososphaerota archaeon]